MGEILMVTKTHSITLKALIYKESSTLSIFRCFSYLPWLFLSRGNDVGKFIVSNACENMASEGTGKIIVGKYVAESLLWQ